MWKKVLIGVVALIVLLLIIGFFLPSDYTVVRTASIKAKPEAVFAQIVDFNQWDSWAAWNKKRFPDMKTKMTGEPGAVGCVWDWEGTESGKGRMVLKEAASPNKAVIELTFFDKNDTYVSQITFDIKTKGDEVEVVWSDKGNTGKGPIAGYFALMMDGMMGKDFQDGLDGMKAKLEKAG